MIFYAKENLFLFFFIGMELQPSRFLKNTMEISSFYQLPALENIFLPPEIHINFSFILKFINSSFLLNISFVFV